MMTVFCTRHSPHISSLLSYILEEMLVSFEGDFKLAALGTEWNFFLLD